VGKVGQVNQALTSRPGGLNPVGQCSVNI
jgi:hypothetical protein